VRVLVVSDGTWGNVSPFLAIARDLAGDRGHEVLTIVNPVFADAAGQLGLSHRTAGEPWGILDAAEAVKVMRPGIGTIRVLRRHFVPQIPAWIRATQEALESFRPDARLGCPRKGLT
jgi:UDP:flavonoid glycosyltransferase YjiC (YdhE family)